jgi:hypothetical protein
MEDMIMARLPVVPPEVRVRLAVTPADCGKLLNFDWLDELLLALGRTGPVYTTRLPDGWELVTDGLHCRVDFGGYRTDPGRSGLDLRIDAMPGVTGVFNETVLAAVRQLIERLGFGVDDLKFHFISAVSCLNRDALRLAHGDLPADRPAPAGPGTVWLLRKPRVFVQIRLLESGEVRE